jgi:transcriptional regulator with XRE-family HTH domain
MTLDEFRKQKNWSYSHLARQLGAAHATVVRRWCLKQSHKDHVKPNPRFMSRIVVLTQGQVTPNDVYLSKDL